MRRATARRSEPGRSRAAASSVPIERLLPPRVEEADDQDRDEDGHLDEAVPAEASEEHRPGKQEDDLDVEHHEQQREDVEMGRITAPRLPDRLLPRLVGAELFDRRLAR